MHAEQIFRVLLAFSQVWILESVCQAAKSYLNPMSFRESLAQGRHAPGACGPIPMNLREFLAIVKTPVDWALIKNGFPSIFMVCFRFFHSCVCFL